MKIAIITNKPYKRCETFIKSEIDLLPFEKEHYHGKNIPYDLLNKKNVNSLTDKLVKKIVPSKRKTGYTNFKKELIVQKIDLVLAQYGTVGAKILPICLELNLPLIVHFHGQDAVRKSVLKEYGQMYAEMFAYKRTTVISVSLEMTERLINIGCPKEKIKYNTYGPEDGFLTLQPNYSKPQFISIGRFVEKKAPHLLILAFNEVLKTYPTSKLIYGGDGHLFDSCKDLVEALKIEKSVIFPGYITPEDYRTYLLDSICYVQQSIEAQDGDMEGTPLSILEASVAGLPIVSTIHAGIPDVIKNGITGLLSEERDYLAMAENMKWIMQDPSRAINMGKKGKEHITKFFSKKIQIDGLTKILNEAIKKK